MAKLIKTPSYSIAVFGTDDNSFNVTAALLVKGSHSSLINAGFTRRTATKIAGYVRDNGLTLDEVFVIHGDSDYYFGLEQIFRAYPGVVACSTAETAARITSTVLNKLNVWSGQLGNDAPDNIIVPKILTGGSYNILGERFEIVGNDHNRINLWDAGNSVLVGGIDVFNEIHVFLADTGSREKLTAWLGRLEALRRLNPKIVIPGHGVLDGSFDEGAVEAIAGYLRYVIDAMKDGGNSAELSGDLLRHFTGYANTGVVELGAKVLTGEIIW